MRHDIKVILLLETAIAGAGYGKQNLILDFSDVSSDYLNLMRDLYDEDSFERGRIIVLESKSDYYGAVDTLPDLIKLRTPVLLGDERPVCPQSILRDQYRYRKPLPHALRPLYRRGCRHR